MKHPSRLIITCEHAGYRIPREYAHLFRGATQVLASHRGWDPGARPLARFLARHLRVPLQAVTWSRLLVDSNRSPSNPRIWSPYTADLTPRDKRELLQRYWWPHRHAVETQISQLSAHRARVMHIAVHSFVPVLNGTRRNTDIGLLYDPRRPAEKVLCGRWVRILQSLDPALRIRRNYPYRGVNDGFTAWLRKRYADEQYAGVELEINQAQLTDGGRTRLSRLLARSIEDLLVADTGPAPA